MGQNTFSNISEYDLLITRECYENMKANLKVTRLCFTGSPAFQDHVNICQEKIVRISLLLDAVLMELSLREIKKNV